MDWTPTAEIGKAHDIIAIKLVAEVSPHDSTEDQAYWWGRSIYQIAEIVDGEVRCQGRVVKPSGIVGWIQLPD